jgi:hypothetical protein
MKCFCKFFPLQLKEELCGKKEEILKAQESLTKFFFVNFVLKFFS